MNLKSEQQSIERIASNARLNMDKITANKTLDKGYKRQEVRRIRDAAIAEIESYHAILKDLNNDTITSLKAKAARPIMPPPEIANELLYAKMRLEERWKSMTSADLHKDFETAIAAKDTVHSRLYMDFGAGQVINLYKATPVATGVLGNMNTVRSTPTIEQLSPEWVKLHTRAEELLMPSDQLKARKEMVQIEADQREFNMTVGGTRADLERIIYDPQTDAVGKELAFKF